MKLIVTSLHRWTVALQLHILVSVHISHSYQYIRKFPKPTNENFDDEQWKFEKIQFYRMSIYFDGALFLTDFGQKLQKIVKLFCEDQLSIVSEICDLNSSQIEKSSPWSWFLCWQEGNWNWVHVFVWGQSPQTFTGKLCQFHSGQQRNQLHRENFSICELFKSHTSDTIDDWFSPNLYFNNIL